MDVECLDLCISCGSHVADGTAYCSMQCRSQDQSPLYRSAFPSSSSHRYSHPSTASSSSRRPRLDLQDAAYYYPTPAYSEEQQQKKLQRIAHWAKGVWGGADDEDDESQAGPSTRSPKFSKAKSPSTSPARSYTPPRFALTAQHLAPPAMSIARSSAASASDDDFSSILTPSSSASSHRSKHMKAAKPQVVDSMDPWISSPPYEFAYNHFAQAKQLPVERGRTLVRV